MTELSVFDLAGTIISALLTVMIFTYLLGDNFFFRLATYLFIGVAAGYAGSIAWHNVLWPGLFQPLLTRKLGEIFEPTSVVTLIIPWLLVLLLLLRISPIGSRYAGLPMALLVGVGAAVIVGGGITGTLIPQSINAMETLDPTAQAPLTGEGGLERFTDVLVMLLGTISTLVYFRFSAKRELTGEARRTLPTALLAAFGRFFIAVTFGVMYAGAIAASIVILTDRIQFLRDVISLLVGVVAGA
ncbi:MAG: hypothetical protein GTO14_16740 [Anaerolineales bacterium]|nr:hypothetical protein [Anaerolineales bacterium]